MTPNAGRDIEALLPWYANGTLDPTEVAVVERHLDQYPTCRVELEQCRALVDLIETHDVTTWQPAPDAFDRLMADVNQLEAAPIAAPVLVPIRAASSLWQQILEWLRHTPSPVRWTLAVESLAVMALVLVVLLPSPSPMDPGYETLSNSEEPTVTTGQQMRVVFDDQMRVGELRTLLGDIAGRIVAGPTALGIYTVAVANGDSAKGALDRAVAVLRAHPHVRLVEPLAR